MWWTLLTDKSAELKLLQMYCALLMQWRKWGKLNCHDFLFLVRVALAPEKEQNVSAGKSIYDMHLWVGTLMKYQAKEIACYRKGLPIILRGYETEAHHLLGNVVIDVCNNITQSHKTVMTVVVGWSLWTTERQKLAFPPIYLRQLPWKVLAGWWLNTGQSHLSYLFIHFTIAWSVSDPIL